MKMILSAREEIKDSAAGNIILYNAGNINDDDCICHELEINTNRSFKESPLSLKLNSEIR